MVNKATYQQLRKKYPTLSAVSAYREAKQEKPMAIDWDEDRRSGEKSAAIEIDGFTVRLTVAYDYDYDWLDSRGKFSSKWQEGAIRNPASVHDNRVYEWFIPANTEEEHYKGLRQLKYSRTEAREEARKYVQQDMKIACDPDEAGYYAVYVRAKASKAGITLGEGSLHGIELSYDDSDDYVNECAWDVAREAVNEAKAHLAELRESL